MTQTRLNKHYIYIEVSVDGYADLLTIGWVLVDIPGEKWSHGTDFAAVNVWVSHRKKSSFSSVLLSVSAVTIVSLQRLGLWGDDRAISTEGGRDGAGRSRETKEQRTLEDHWQRAGVVPDQGRALCVYPPRLTFSLKLLKGWISRWLFPCFTLRPTDRSDWTNCWRSTRAQPTSLLCKAIAPTHRWDLIPLPP